MSSPLTEHQPPTGMRIGYVMKRYPRFSETFIVNEILAHESQGLDLEIFALRPCVDTHFQDIISKVRSPVSYLASGSIKSNHFWEFLQEGAGQFPCLWAALENAQFASGPEVHQALQLAQKIVDRGITHLHAHFASSAATVAQLASAIAGVGYSITMHAKDIFHESVNPDDLACKIADSEFIVTVSDFNKRFLEERYGFGAKIHRIYNGLDLTEFRFHDDANSTRRILGIGRLVEKKGFRHLIDACRRLLDWGVDFDCEIIGTGELEGDLERMIREQQLADVVRLIGPQPQKVVRKKMAESAVLAAPCVVGADGNRDGLPTVITESLALGTPCISTSVTGIPEIIEPDETGILVDQGDSVALANQLRRLLEAPQLRARLSRAARERIEQDFDIHRNAARIRELFESASDRGVLPVQELQKA